MVKLQLCASAGEAATATPAATARAMINPAFTIGSQT
jgi:hypothetical protein